MEQQDMNKIVTRLQQDLLDDNIKRQHYYEVIIKHAREARRHITEMEKLAKHMSEINTKIEE